MSPPIAPTIRIITAAETIDLRHRVMWPDRPKQDVMIPNDHTATHFGAFHNDNIIGVASFFPDGTSCRLRKLAVDQNFQGNGVASQIINTAITYLRKLGYIKIWCDARVSATEFYRRNGFAIETQVFQKRDIDYIKAAISI